MKRLKRLVGVWVAVTLLALLVNGLAQQPVPYTDDACLSTCGRCDFKIRNVAWHRWLCCVWDQGCWANPLEPDYQVSLCDREEVFCVVITPWGGYGYRVVNQP